MLVLSRKQDEKLVIGNDIVVTVLDIRGDKVRLGIDAPDNVAVNRLEVWEAMQRQRSQKVDTKPEPPEIKS